MDANFAQHFPIENPFDFLKQSISLQNLAATKIASTLWQNKYNVKIGCALHFSERPVLLESLMKHCAFSCREFFEVPSHIRGIIDDVILIIGEEIKKWEENYKAAVVRANQHGLSNKTLFEIFIKSLDNISLKPDGTFSLRGCVENVLTNGKLCQMQKLRIACLFYLENRVWEMWPLVSEMQNVGDLPPWMVYWKNILNNVAIDECFLIEQLSASVTARNWSAFEYLWNKLTEESQTREAVAIIQKQHKLYSIRCVLFQLNENQVREICAQNGHHVFKGLLEMEHDEYYEYATKLWQYSKNFISGEVFSNIIRALWNMTFNPAEYHITRVNRCSQLLCEIWFGAPESLKSFVWTNELFATLDSNARSVHHYDLTFIFKLLHKMNQSSRESIWESYWSTLIIRAKIPDQELLIEYCFLFRQTFDRWKENIETRFDESLTDYFSGCINKALYSDLYDCLTFFTTNPRRLENLGKEIVLSNLEHIVLHDDEKLSMCHSFIYSTFREGRVAEKFLGELISSPECLGLVYSRLDNGCFDDIVSLCNMFPTSSQTLQEIKLGFTAYCYREFARGQFTGFDEQKFNEFTSWCSLEEEKITEFKKSLIIDDIFEIVANNFLREYLTKPYSPNLLPLVHFDQFLRWYFGSSETAKQYKSIKFSNYNEWEGIKNALLKSPPQFVDLILSWAFEKNNEKVNRVKSTLNRSFDVAVFPLGLYPL